MNVITKKSPTTTTAATSGTSYLSMMTSNVASTNNNNNIKRRESSMGEDSVSFQSFSMRIFYVNLMRTNEIYMFMTFDNEKAKEKQMKVKS